MQQVITLEPLTQLEHQIELLLLAEEYPDDFPQQLENLVALRHQQVELVLKQPDLSRAVFDDVVARTQVMKGLLQQHKDRIGAQLVRSKKSQKSLSLYSNIQQHGQ
ncbi:flagellar biosynthesis protein FliS [Photobacterium kishitanii]|uniref:Flagellar biosynthesis protein FliS n=1 Tax=Photobacterium kishitanii TaxID=318456 RepID=A0AAX0YYK9_9GAMM|nr:flagellar biosynthesis protein FliS [Photobacterium kishitanii]KJG57522.1 flagellar biosynthesis protein FliS [Photobacterium kishitanii]KJG61174.1 flagellar biosynthesis protein FliS [Photobacterium kishitanii]KJG65366.1 flagellar biosynthesis protein FliS [Photobacterium kishitanii]KJG69472.1 flagellar biosynthesis protein FliS [Photobacterium kishitanii]PSX21482.1 flagellar biosynthesis protein FliS [Photobacterium kishitanii]